MLADLEIDGGMHRVVMQAPKNGFFYVLMLKRRADIAENYTPVTGQRT